MSQEASTENNGEYSIQFKVDKYSGWLLRIYGSIFLLLTLFLMVFVLKNSEYFNSIAWISVYNLIMAILCLSKGNVLIKRAGHPAYTFAGDNHNWKARLVITFMLIIFTLVLVTGLAGDSSLIVLINLMPLIIILL